MLKQNGSERILAEDSLGFAAQQALDELRNVGRVNPEAHQLKARKWLDAVAEHLRSGFESLKHDSGELRICTTSVRAIEKSFDADGKYSVFMETYHILLITLRSGKGSRAEIDSVRGLLKRLLQEFHYHRISAA